MNGAHVRWSWEGLRPVVSGTVKAFLGVLELAYEGVVWACTSQTWVTSFCSKREQPCGVSYE